jgi:hypothetical protein
MAANLTPGGSKMFLDGAENLEEIDGCDVKWNSVPDSGERAMERYGTYFSSGPDGL